MDVAPFVTPPKEDHVSPSIPGLNIQKATADQHLIDLKKEGEWGDHFCIIANGEMVGRRIRVYTTANDKIIAPPGPNTDKYLNILLYSSHFCAMFPLLLEASMELSNETRELLREAVVADVQGTKYYFLGIYGDGNCLFRAFVVLYRIYGIDVQKIISRFWFNMEVPAVTVGAAKMWYDCSVVDVERRLEWHARKHGF